MIDLPLLTYMATMSVTPGPNNLMLAASGVNHGLRRTVPHLLGISVGVAIQIVLVGSALSWVLAWFDGIRDPLVLAGCSYLLWLAWRQSRAAQPGDGGVHQGRAAAHDLPPARTARPLQGPGPRHAAGLRALIQPGAPDAG